jgi:homocysteine S-methyltransferase
MRGTSGTAGTREGMAICGELLGVAKEQGIGGYYLIPPFGKIALAAELVRAIRA